MISVDGPQVCEVAGERSLTDEQNAGQPETNADRQTEGDKHATRGKHRRNMGR